MVELPLVVSNCGPKADARRRNAVNEAAVAGVGGLAVLQECGGVPLPKTMRWWRPTGPDGVGRATNAIGWDTSVFSLVPKSNGVMVLPRSPWAITCPWVVLLHKPTGQRLVVVNMHLHPDPGSSANAQAVWRAQRQAVDNLARRLWDEYDAELSIVAGDGNENGTYAFSGHRDVKTPKTWQARRPTRRYDRIFVRGPITFKRVTAHRTTSDHLRLLGDMKIGDAMSEYLKWSRKSQKALAEDVAQEILRTTLFKTEPKNIKQGTVRHLFQQLWRGLQK